MSGKKKPAEEAAIQELRSDIAETRTDLGETVEALAAKTDVRERVKESVRRRPARWGLVVAGVVAALTAVGVLSRRRR
jgi:Protein of unknown function (DUF3618)